MHTGQSLINTDIEAPAPHKIKYHNNRPTKEQQKNEVKKSVRVGPKQVPSKRVFGFTYRGPTDPILECVFEFFALPPKQKHNIKITRTAARAPVCRCRGQTIWVLLDDVWLDRTSAIRQPQRLDWGHFGIYIFVIEWMEMKWSAFLDYYYDGRWPIGVLCRFKFWLHAMARIPTRRSRICLNRIVYLALLLSILCGMFAWMESNGDGFHSHRCCDASRPASY